MRNPVSSGHFLSSNCYLAPFHVSHSMKTASSLGMSDATPMCSAVAKMTKP